jgi:hypothetical protein
MMTAAQIAAAISAIQARVRAAPVEGSVPVTQIWQALASARQAGVLGALSIRSGLVLHVLAKDLDRRTASRDEAIAWRPEHSSSTVGGTQRGELLAQEARGYR